MRQRPETTLENIRSLEKERWERSKKLVQAAEARRTRKDRSYEAEINLLIPLAAQFADESMTPRPRDPSRGTAWDQTWDRIYFQEMDRLAEVHGLRKRSEP